MISLEYELFWTGVFYDEIGHVYSFYLSRHCDMIVYKSIP